MAAPTIDPQLHASNTGSACDTYQPGAWVWVHANGSWRPGIVLQCSPRAVTVRYRPAEGRGTGVDTVTPRSLAIRSDSDPCVDSLVAELAPRTAVPLAPAAPLAPGMVPAPPLPRPRQPV